MWPQQKSRFPRISTYILGSFCLVTALARVAHAETEVPYDLWEPDVELWDDPWDRPWFDRGGRMVLSLTAGHRSAALGSNEASLLDPMSAGESGGSVAPASRSQASETYGYLTLTVPTDALLSRAYVAPLPRKESPDEQVASDEASADFEEEARAPQDAARVRLALRSETTEAKGSRATDQTSTARAKSETGQGAPAQEDSQGVEDLPATPDLAPAQADSPAPSPEKPPVLDSKAYARQARTRRNALLGLLKETLKHVGVAQGHSADELRIRNLSKRSRHSGLAPEVRLRGVYGSDQSTSLEDSVGIYPGESSTRGGTDSLAEVRLTFRLDRLVFGDEETTLERHRAKLREDRQKTIRETADLLLDWYQADARVLDPSLLPEEQLELEVKAQEALVHLHLLTGGWFQGWDSVR